MAIFGAGLFIGVWAGFVVAVLCAAARRGDEQVEQALRDEELLRLCQEQTG